MKEMKLDRHEFNLLVNDILLDVKPVKLRISIANRLIEFFDKKQEQIAELEDKWNKLREWAKNSTEVLLYSIGDKPAKLGNKKYNYFERKQLLDKMQELENGEKR